MARLAEQNAHPRDARIKFEESTHTYTLDGDASQNTSVTTFLHKLFPHFDADSVIEKMMSGRNWSKSPYFGRTKESIKNGWEKSGRLAADQGTKMHLNIENFYEGLPHETSSKEFKLFQEFVNDHPWEMYRTEWVVFHEEAKICGSIDAVFKDPDDDKALVIADWKRSKEIKYQNSWESGTHPLTKGLQHCNFILYSLQLSTYRFILEVKYGAKINQTPFLVILHPSQTSYQKIETIDLRDVVKKLFDERIN
ncbi:unnamed protein product, partial [Phaeothamnion confervicola]